MHLENVVAVNHSVDNMGKSDYYIHNCSFTLLEGKNCLEHMNRLVTSNINNLKDLESKNTLMCNANGRIIDTLEIISIGEQLLLIGNSEMANDTRDIIVSGIHWNEEVTVMNGDNILTKLSLIGSKSEIDEFLSAEKLQSKENQWLVFDEFYLKRTNHGKDSKIDLIMKNDQIDNFIEEKIGLNSKKLSRNEWDEIRILYQILSYNEYKHDLLPSEIGLDHLVDLKKGCYPGQEIHARMESRGKLKKKIMKFNSDSDILSGKFLTDNKKKINITTSVGKSGFFLINNIGEEKLIIDNVTLEINELKSIKIS